MDTLRDVELFKVGKWNGMTFDESALDDMVAAFNELSQVHRVPLKLGHRADEQVPKGQPALGWVTHLKRVGKSLLGSFANVPTVIVNAIKQKKYRTVSIEMLMGAKLGDRSYAHVLDAVALLGAEQPAVHGLADLDQFLAERASFDVVDSTASFELVADEPPPHRTAADDADLRQTEIERLTAELGRLTTELAAAKTRAEAAEQKAAAAVEQQQRERSDREQFTRDQRADTVTSRRAAAREFLEDQVRAYKLLPAQREVLSNLYRLDDDAAVERLDFEAFKAAATELGRVAALHGPLAAGRSTAFAAGPSRVESAPDTELVRLTYERMNTTGEKSFAVAFAAVARQNPELHVEYLNMNR